VKGLKHPATVIAALALFIALGGGAAWASGLIPGSKIKNHSIAAKKLTKSAIKSLHGKRGATGPKGATGAQGIQGVQGVQGPPGPSNMIRWNTTSGVRDVVGTSSAPNLTNHSDRTGIVTVATVGTLKVDGICWDDGTNTFAATFIETTQDGALAQGYSSEGKEPLNIADGPVQISEDVAGNAAFFDLLDGPDDGSWVAENAAATTILEGFGNQQVAATGAAGPCRFSGFLVEVATP